MNPDKIARFEEAARLYHEISQAVAFLFLAFCWLHDPRKGFDDVFLAHECLHAGRWVTTEPVEQVRAWISKPVKGVN